MSRITGKNTKPELIIRRILWNEGFRYRLHQKDIPGKPDIVFSKKRKVIFVHGCFWHQHNCIYFKLPEQNREFWQKKLNANKKRDAQNELLLTEKGWKVLIIWECEIKKIKENKIIEKVLYFLKSP